MPLDSYLPKLVRAGRRVAICEQLEDPKLTKKLVKRGITELVTPGVNTSPGALQTKENNFLAAIHVGKKSVGLLSSTYPRVSSCVRKRRLKRPTECSATWPRRSCCA